MEASGGCVRLDERRASRAACLSYGLCAQLTWASRYVSTMRTGELGRRKILAGWRTGFCTPAKIFRSASSAGCVVRGPTRSRSILGTVSLACFAFLCGRLCAHRAAARVPLL
jgi:hypothetical protein